MTLGMLEGPDLIIVLVIVMVMFGAKRLPELARGLGQAKKEFENAVSDKPTPVSPSPATLPAVSPPATTDTVTMSRNDYETLRKAADPSRTSQP